MSKILQIHSGYQEAVSKVGCTIKPGVSFKCWVPTHSSPESWRWVVQERWEVGLTGGVEGRGKGCGCPTLPTQQLPS